MVIGSQIVQLMSRSFMTKVARNRNLMGTTTQRYFADEQKKEEEALKEKVEQPKKEQSKDQPKENAENPGVKEIESKLKLMTDEANKYKDYYLRTLAEQDNIRKRLTQEIENERTYAITKFAKEMLDVSDNLKRAIDNVPKEFHTPEEKEKAFIDLVQGVSMTRDIMLGVYKKFSITEVNPLDQKFDPNFHEALYTFEDEKKQDGTVGNVITPGYTIGGRVLRSAKVGVIKKTNK